VGVITFRTDDAEELQELAAARGVPVSSLLRDQVDVLLGRRGPLAGETDPRSGTHVSLSRVDRKILAQQHEILANLTSSDPGDREYHLQLATVLNSGFAAEYGRVFEAVEPELTRDQCLLLWNILDMFRVLGASVAQLGPEEREQLGERLYYLQYNGFDFNDPLEMRLHIYLEYLLETARWQEVAPRLEEMGGGNSHSPMLSQYMRMLVVHEAILARRREREHGLAVYSFTADELAAVADA
jgi:uncharacterized protein YfbU (UPF0304 family)